MEEEKKILNNQEQTGNQPIKEPVSKVDLNHPSDVEAALDSVSQPSLSNTENTSVQIFFSVKFGYVIPHPQFKEEQLPIELGGTQRRIKIEQVKHRNIILDENGEIDQTATGNQKEYDKLLITIVKEASLSKKRFKEFSDRLNEGKLISLFEGEGRIKSTLNDHFPGLEMEVDRIYKLIRWRYRIDGKTLVCSNEYSWSEDGHTWNSINSCAPPSMVDVEMIPDVIQSKDEITQTISDLLDNNIYEPLYHTLIREATSILNTNPESAFVIAVAALEVGVKHFIAVKVPASAWLITNMPSPDIHKLLKEYLPRLDHGFRLTDEQLKDVKNIMTNRNTMVHAGIIDYDDDSILKCINLIKLILVKIDAHLGFTW